MTILDVPCDGRATFHRLGVRGLRDKLLADEARRPEPTPGEYSRALCEGIVTTYLRPVEYVMRSIGSLRP
jgi:hypothetical protein